MINAFNNVPMPGFCFKGIHNSKTDTLIHKSAEFQLNMNYKLIFLQPKQSRDLPQPPDASKRVSPRPNKNKPNIKK